MDYTGRMRAGQREVYYLAAPSRQLAESSPYYEALRKKDVEILFCFESYDELVLMQLQQFNKLKIKVCHTLIYITSYNLLYYKGVCFGL